VCVALVLLAILPCSRGQMDGRRNCSLKYRTIRQTHLVPFEPSPDSVTVTVASVFVTETVTLPSAS
jgi:hypothetical protein